jgi:phage terminase large subunit GpA-like protein
MRGVMDAVSDPTVRQVVVMSAAQVGKTEVLLNMIGFHVDQDPAPILVVQPTLSMAQAFSKDRLAPMLRDTPNLKGKVRDPRSRDSGNTTLHKVFPGGHVTIAGANSAAGLASRPMRIVLCDEVDRYPSSAGTEGDPIRLAAKRATTFWNAKVVTVSRRSLSTVTSVTTGFRAHTATKRRPCAGDQCSGNQTDRRRQSMFANIVALSGVMLTASNH